jgi:glycine cleavage system regulatory protein
MLRQVLSFPRRRPVIFGLGFSCIKTSFADYLVQKTIEKREELDVRRNIAFGLFGLVYLGGVQYAIYVPGFRRLFPLAEKFAAMSLREKIHNRKGIFSMVAQVFLDQCLHHPLMYFPAFYFVKTLVQGGTTSDAFSLYKSNIKEDMLALWKVWVPATIVNFTFSPMWLRIPFVATTSLLWTCILSARRGDWKKPVEDAHEAVLNTARAVHAWAMRKEAHLDPSKAHLVMMAQGPDRIGIVRDIAHVVDQSGGSVATSKMTRLAGSFSVMMLISVDKPALSHLMERLRGLEGLQVMTRVTGPNGPQQEQIVRLPYTARMTVTGKDAPSVAAKLAEYLAANKINIEDLSSDCSMPHPEPQPQPDRAPILTLEANLASEHTVDAAKLRLGLTELSKKLGVTVRVWDERCEASPSAIVSMTEMIPSSPSSALTARVKVPSA